MSRPLAVQVTTGAPTSIDELRALDAPSTERARVSVGGYWTEGDGGGGDFYWVADSTDDDDGGLIFRPNSVSSGSPGRWWRFYVQGELNCKWYGAIGDGTSNTLSSLQPSWTLADWQAIYPLANSLSNEIDWLATLTAIHRTQIYYPNPSGSGRNVRGGTVIVPFGLYYHDQPMTAPPSPAGQYWAVRLKGVGPQGAPSSAFLGGASWIVYTGAADRYFDLRSAYFAEFEDLTVWYNNPSFAGKILFDGTWYPAVNADSTYLRFKRCSLAGDPSVFGAGQGAAALISFHLSIICDVKECAFGMAETHIRFRRFPVSGQAYSNKINVRDGSHNYARYCFANVGECVTISGNALEGLGGYTEAGLTDICQFTEATPAVTFEVDAATQTITLVDAGGKTWADYGFVVGMTPFLHDRLNRVNGPNNITCQPITSFSGGGLVMHVPGSGLVDQTNTWGSMSAATLSAGVPGAFVRATVGVTLVFDATAKTITRSSGSWLDDNWTVGDTQVAISTPLNNFVGGPITALSATVMEIASATFVNETTDDGQMCVTTGAGPCTFTDNWCGDQFLPGSAWIDCKHPISGWRIQGNLLVGATRAIRLRNGGTYFQVMTNAISSTLCPMYVNLRGLNLGHYSVMNNACAMPFLDPEGQQSLVNQFQICNSQDARDIIDLVLESVTLRAALTVVANGVGNMTGFYDAAIAFTQSSGGSMGLGSDADHTLIEAFGGNGLFLNKLGGGYTNVGRLGSYNAVSKTAIPHSALDVGGAPAFAWVTDTANHQISDREAFCAADATLGPRTWTLESAVGCAGRRHSIVKIDGTANAVTVATTGGQTVLLKSGSSLTLAAQGDGITVVSDGANWIQEP